MMKGLLLVNFMTLLIVGCSREEPPVLIVELHRHIGNHELTVRLDTVGLDGGRDTARVMLSVIQDGLLREADILMNIDVHSLYDGTITERELDGDRRTPEFVVLAGRSGVTFGANELAVIYYPNRRIGWTIAPSPFVRADVVDVEGDGVFEVVEFYHASRPTGDVYRFDRGKWILDSSAVFIPEVDSIDVPVSAS